MPSSTKLTLDASVMIKWLFPEKPNEANATQAIQLLKDYQYGEFELIQPTHYLAEISAVATRISPKTAAKKTELIYSMNIKEDDNLFIHQIAIKLAETFNHHLFDTLYHAVALANHETILITADEAYYRKAKKQGRIKLLSDN